MNIELREDIEAIIGTIRERIKEKKILEAEIKDLTEEINDIQARIYQREDDVESCDDAINLAKTQFLELLDDETQLDEDPVDLMRRAFKGDYSGN
jgi:septal ring factor EnvC (AmiA/AmiB activator)